MKLAHGIGRRTGKIAAWVATFAILLAALAPSLGRALAPPQQAMPWAQICTAAGMQAAPDAAPASGTGQHGDPGFKHCPFCLNHVGHFALPTAALDGLPAADAGARFFPPSATPPAPRFIRIGAPPRAPPAIS